MTRLEKVAFTFNWVVTIYITAHLIYFFIRG